ncbi:hypothetical protein DAETH_33240 (plasmid) [Deinococcus aetherius]|uniref:Uncharacterized protein n=1 Tax=Deinococcus aetherius TaxID=200252 RepID=A0ABN6RJ09_9DEIO|nr:hypothetical protein [Deinococcus aetherius]BDP43355.1 hypothetical protein DAETH_33240 [Deinococcus aetherius]
MGRRSVLLILSTLATAHALPPADCSQYVFVRPTSLSYLSLPQFPNEAETVAIDFLEPQGAAKPVSLCGFTFKPDVVNRVLTVSAPRLSKFSTLFREKTKAASKIFLENAYRGAGGSVPIEDSYVVFDPASYVLTFQLPRYQQAPSRFTVGVKVDGGPIQPLYFNRKVQKVNVLRTARVVDIYAKGGPNDSVSWQRVRMDLKGAVIEMYRQATFPTR